MLEEDRILKINIEKEMKSAYIDYSMSVIVSRALPDVRDGLKPVHRRVLFGMNEMGNTSDKPHKKSANCVGEVMGKYHGRLHRFPIINQVAAGITHRMGIFRDMERVLDVVCTFHRPTYP